MKQHFKRLFISLLLVFTVQVATAAPDDVQNEANSSFIFTFSDSFTGDIPAAATDLVARYNGELRHVYQTIFKGFSASMSRSDAINLVGEPEVDRFVENGVASVSGAGGQGGGTGGSKGKGKKFTADEIISWGAERVGPRDATSDGIKRRAWIIDTGVDDYYSGTELNIEPGINKVTTRGKGRSEEDTDDTNGHGTHIAGILAAIKGNETGVQGIAAGATVHPVRVLHNNLWGTMDDILAGVEFVAVQIPKYPNDRHVVNMSLTIEAAIQDELLLKLFDDGVKQIADYSNAYVAVCAGNDSADANLYSPAYLSGNPHVYTVASMDEEEILATDSNIGIPPISFVAPGVRIESLKPGGGTWFWSGCSMATPHVAGILLFQDSPVQRGSVMSGGLAYPIAGF